MRRCSKIYKWPISWLSCPTLVKVYIFFNGNLMRNCNMLLILVQYLQEKSFGWKCVKNCEIILWFLTTLYVLTRTKLATKYIISWKVIITSFKINNCFYLVIFLNKISGYWVWWPKCTFLWCYTLYNFLHTLYFQCIRCNKKIRIKIFV